MASTKNNPHRFLTRMVIVILLILSLPASAESIHVAVASNFINAFNALANYHQQQTGHIIIPIPGSSGKHYAQIHNNAPFAAYFSADAKHPQRLEAEGKTILGSRFTYALGILALWSPTTNMVDPSGQVLQHGSFQHLALANPDLAPYGLAAKQVLQRLNLWQGLQNKLVMGENIGQTLQFVASDNAQLGFIAWSQIHSPTTPLQGSWWKVPPNLYETMEQQAVLLKPDPIAQEFFKFVQSPQGRTIIQDHGYDLPSVP